MPPVPVATPDPPASCSPFRLPADESRLSANAPSCAPVPAAADAPAAPPPPEPRTNREGSVPARARVVVPLLPDPDPGAALRALLSMRVLPGFSVMFGVPSSPSRGAIAVALGWRGRRERSDDAACSGQPNSRHSRGGAEDVRPQATNSKGQGTLP